MKKKLKITQESCETMGIYVDLICELTKGLFETVR